MADLAEVDAVFRFLEDAKPLAAWVRSGKPVSNDTRKFIADVLEGKVKRSRGKPKGKYGYASRPGICRHISCRLFLYSLVRLSTNVSERQVDTVNGHSITAMNIRPPNRLKCIKRILRCELMQRNTWLV